MTTRPDLSDAPKKWRIDQPTSAHLLPGEDGATLIVCQNEAGECQEPFVCPSENCVIEVIERLTEIHPNIEVVRETARERDRAA